MKIASKIHPRNGQVRNVPVNGHLYAFTRTEDKHSTVHFVADVKNEDHAQVLMGHDAFYAYDSALAPVATLVQAPKDPVDPPPPPPAFDVEVTAEANKLLKDSAGKISVALGKVSSPEVVLAAIAIEKAAPAMRKSVVALLESTREGLIAAGKLTA